MKKFALKALFCTSALTFLALPSAFAEDKDSVGTISFSNIKDAKAIVYVSYETLYQLNDELKKLAKLAVQGANGTYSSAQLLAIDQTFQTEKKKIEDSLNQQTKISFSVFNDNDVSIDIKDDGHGNHLKFDLPKMHISDLTMNNDALVTTTDAQLAVTHVRQDIEKINNMLPAGINSSQLKPFITTTSIASYENQFSVTDINDNHALLQSLVSLHDLLIKQLTALLETANQAAQGTHSQTEMGNLDTTFQAQRHELERLLSSSSYIGNIKDFNNSYLTMSDKHNYHFVKIDMQTLNLKNDNVLSMSDAEKTLGHLSTAFTWISDWTVNGNSSYINNTNEGNNNKLVLRNIQ